MKFHRAEFNKIYIPTLHLYEFILGDLADETNILASYLDIGTV